MLMQLLKAILLVLCVASVGVSSSFAKEHQDYLEPFKSALESSSPVNISGYPQLHSFPLSKRDVSSATVGGQHIPAPSRVEELPNFLKKIHAVIHEAQVAGKKEIIFVYGQHKPMTLKLPYLGRGGNGIVFELIDKDHTNAVLKLAVENLHAMGTLIVEHQVVEFWQKAADEYKTFDIPKERGFDRLGLFRIIEKNSGETLTKTLLRFGLLKIDASSNVSFDVGPLKGPHAEAIKVIERALLDMVKAVLAHPKLCPSFSPHNVHLVYRDGKIVSVALVDIGPTRTKYDQYKKLLSFADFLPIAADRLRKYLADDNYRYDQPELLKFKR